jgi:hypothetical protein
MNPRLQFAEAVLSEGGLIPVDFAVSLMADGIDMKTIEDRIDGFSIIDFEEIDYTDYE